MFQGHSTGCITSLLVTGHGFTHSSVGKTIPWHICGQLHSALVIKDSHAAAKGAAGKRKLVVLQPKITDTFVPRLCLCSGGSWWGYESCHPPS